MNDLPIEHVMVDGAVYEDGAGIVGRWNSVTENFACKGYKATPTHGVLRRLVAVAVYEATPTEPAGVGAVLKDSHGRILIRLLAGVWRDKWGYHHAWSEISHPITVVSEGVIL